MKNISIIGSGTWGTALAIHLAKMGNNIKMWSYSEAEPDMINNKRAHKNLPNAAIPKKVFCTTDMGEAIADTEIVLIVTPSKVVREVTKQFKPHLTNQQIVICSKGFERETLYTLDEVVEEELPGFKIGGLSRTEPCRGSIDGDTDSFSYCIKT